MQIALRIASNNGWSSQVALLGRQFDLTNNSSSSSLGPESGGGKNPVPVAHMLRLQRRLDALAQVARVSASVIEAQRLCSLVLLELLKILAADRAFLFLENASRLVYQCGFSSDGQALSEPSQYASSVVERVSKSQDPSLLTGGSDGRPLESQSAIAHDLRSILAVPLVVGQRCLGVIYLDSRLSTGVFGPDDAQLLSIVAQQVALASRRRAQPNLRSRFSPNVISVSWPNSWERAWPPCSAISTPRRF